VINACDAGREGELIFRYVMEAAECKKPVQRLRLQSMTKESIQDGFSHLRKEEEDDAAALRPPSPARKATGWSASTPPRALTALNAKGGGFFLTTAGRVSDPYPQYSGGPEKQIRAFVS
jgi:DNA topoisomerase-3